MTFLPIADRELRVAARRRGTYWGRIVPAGLALLLWGGIQVLALGGAGLMLGAGQIQFGIFKMLAFLYACGVGLFVTADALSEEKREGTLGLLFLTDLRGYDVIAGKLLSHSIPAFYGLVAAFPIMAIPLLSGGVTGGEFWRTMLALANTMFLSLSAGLLVSSISRQAMRAMNGTLLLMVALLFGPPLLDLGLAGGNPAKSKEIFIYASPWFAFDHADGYHVSNYWLSFGVGHLMAWSFLGLASFCAPRGWQEKSRVTAGPRRPGPARWRYSGDATRREQLDKRPVFWLAARDRSLGRLIWILTLGLAGFYFWAMAVHADPNLAITVFGPIMGMVNFVLTIWMISQACRFFFEGRRNGALELILVTPVTPAELIAGQWAALRRLIVGPTVALTLVYSAGGLFEALAMNNPFGGGATVRVFGPGNFEISNLIAGAITRIANVIAVGWFGMWLGLTERKLSTAVVKTFCYVIVIPAMAIGFMRVAPFIALMRWGAGSAWWISTAIDVVLTVTKDIIFILVARRNLARHFRYVVAMDGGLSAFRAGIPLRTGIRPPPLPQPPPVIR